MAKTATLLIHMFSAGQYFKYRNILHDNIGNFNIKILCSNIYHIYRLDLCYR